MAQQKQLIGHIKGETGPAGPAGPAGTNGENGKDAKIESATATITPGHLDEPTVQVEVGGEVGAQTLTFTFAGLQGADGKNGENGTNGENGAPGEQGAPGKDADITAVNVTVNPGHSEAPTCEASVSGEAGAKTIDLTFSGLQGANGADGQPGKDGEPGKDADITAVNITVNPGHSKAPSATAQVSGETGAKTIDITFEGLQGAPGDAGSDFSPSGSSTDILLGDGTVKSIEEFITENIETIRDAIGLATTEHIGLIPALPGAEHTIAYKAAGSHSEHADVFVTEGRPATAKAGERVSVPLKSEVADVFPIGWTDSSVESPSKDQLQDMKEIDFNSNAQQNYTFTMPNKDITIWIYCDSSGHVTRP